MSLKLSILKSNTRHTSTLIFLHGLGDIGESWMSVLHDARPSGMKIICPTSSIIPVTLLGGAKVPAWYDINIAENLNEPIEDKDGMNRSKEQIHNIINSEIRKGIASDRIIVGGFSQGGALAIYTVLSFPQKLGGLIALSCWLPLNHEFPNYVIAPDNLPIFQAHGEDDKICPAQFGQLTYNFLRPFGRNAQFFIYHNLGHSISSTEIYDMKLFIHQNIKSLPPKFTLCCCFKGSVY